jgi:hypothetical protein
LKTEKIAPKMEVFFCFLIFFRLKGKIYPHLSYLKKLGKNYSENRMNRQPTEKIVFYTIFLTVLYVSIRLHL